MADVLVSIYLISYEEEKFDSIILVKLFKKSDFAIIKLS